MKNFLNFFHTVDVPPKKQKLSNFTYIFLSAGAGTGVVRVDHKKPSAGAVWVRVKNDGSFCSLLFTYPHHILVCDPIEEVYSEKNT